MHFLSIPVICSPVRNQNLLWAATAAAQVRLSRYVVQERWRLNFLLWRRIFEDRRYATCHLGRRRGGGWLLDFWKILTFTSHTNKQQNALQSLACILFTIFSTFFDRYCGHLQVWCFYYMNTERYKCGCVAVTPSSYICHGVGPLVDPFRSHVSRSLFKGLPWFLLPVGQ